MLSIRQRGSFTKTTRFLEGALSGRQYKVLEKYAKEGVTALAAATPKRTGKTAQSWSYEITKSAKGITISWVNTNMNQNIPIALIIQYGHGKKNGGYVKGINYINPAIRPVFDQMVEAVCREVSNL